MNLQETQEAIRLHGITHRLKAQAAGARGDGQEAGRCIAIAAAAQLGRLLAPLPLEAHIPDLVKAAQSHGLVDGLVVENQHAAQAAEPVVKRVGDQPLAPQLPKQD